MKKLSLIFIAALFVCACSKECKDCQQPQSTAKANEKTVQVALEKAVKKVEVKAEEVKAEVKEKVQQADKAVNSALLALEKEYKKIAGKKMGVLAVAPEEQNIVLNLGSNDGFKEEQKILLYKNGKVAAEVSVIELYPEQIKAGFSEGSDPKLFNSGDTLEFGILKSETLQ